MKHILSRLYRPIIMGIIALLCSITAEVISSSKNLMPAEPCFTIHKTDTVTEHKVAMVYAHGIASTHNQSRHFSKYLNRSIDGTYTTNRYWLFAEPVVTFNFPDSQEQGQFNYAYVNLGQKIDQDRLDFAFKKTLEELPTCTQIIGAGISRGATTWLNYAAECRPPQLGALILESPFEAIKSIVNNLLRKFHMSWVPFSTSLTLWAVKKKFTALNVNGPFSLDLVDQIDKDLPIIFIHSRSDQVIPPNSSRKLYVKLLQSGHNHVYILELARGEHGKLMQGMEAELYQNCVHAFLQKYDLPHCAEFAQRGRSLLATCQPSVPEVQKWIKQRRTVPLYDEFDSYDDTVFAVDDNCGTIKLVIDEVTQG